MKKIITLVALCCFVFSSFSQCENPPVPTVVYMTNSCGQPQCFYVTVSGGTAPFTFNIPDGPVLNPNNYACWEVPGVYDIIVTDAAGCIGQDSIIIAPSIAANDVCEAAIALVNGEENTSTLCALNFQNPVCSNMQFSQTGWYSFNSADFSHIQFGAFSQFASSPGLVQGLGIQILAAENNGTCSEATEIYCGNITSCFSFEDNFTITPQTNYYVRVMAAWTSWININVGVVMSNEPITGVCGCTNPLSCNFDPEAIIDNGSCGVNGCTDPSACNYISWATCDDGSCLFGNDITGVFFNDINGNGVRDGWPVLEPALANAGYITINELNVTIYPDASGSFVLPGLDLGSYTVTFHNTAGNWVLTGGDNTQTITLPTCNGLPIGLTPTSGVAAQISGTNMFSTSLIQCNNGFYPGAYINNTGTVPISGTFTIIANPLFTAQTVSYGEPFTNPAPGVFTWEIENMSPGTYLNLVAHINGPGVGYVGQSFPFTFDLELSDGTQVFYSNMWTTNALVSCAYDPNDKQATPEGYTENHFILEDTELQYKIRFQNTGNAPAFDVVIEDQIDAARLDLTTIEPLNASHSFSTIIQPDGLVKFVFNNIMLPDSNSNEPESHGYVIYKIRTKPGIEVGEVINNTAAIFFDDNPPIITNTTYHEIYDCSEIPQFDEEESECYGEEFLQVIEYPYIETIEWFVNGDLVGDEMMFSQMATFGDNWTVQMIITNPLCTVNSQWSIIEEPLPSNEIIYDPINQTLTATEGFLWQWYTGDGEEIEGATEQTFGLENEGSYFVEITSGNGCSVVSDIFSFVSVNEVEKSSIALFPNPVQNELRIQVSTPLIGSDYYVYDVTGREIMRGKISSVVSQIDFSQQSSGSYIIKVGNAQARVQK